MKNKTKLAAAAIVLAALVAGTASPANAYWYNTVKNTGSLTIKVHNTDNKTFSIAAGNSASDINIAYANAGECIKLRRLDTLTTWTYRFPKGGSVQVGGSPFGVVELKKYKC